MKEITKQTLAMAFEDGIAKIVDDMGIRCVIGEHSFYFDHENGDMDLFTYLTLFSTNEIIDKLLPGIATAESASSELGLSKDEWLYYYYTLQEKVTSVRPKYLYEVYSFVTRDAQIARKNDDSMDENDWVDFSGDIMLDVLFAEDEEHAVSIAAEEFGVDKSTLYAVMHTADAVFPDNKRITATPYTRGDKAGIVISTPDDNEALAVRAKETDSRITLSVEYGDSDTRYYLLGFYSKYQMNSVIAGPMELSEAERFLKAYIIERIEEIYSLDEAQATEIYDEAQENMLIGESQQGCLTLSDGKAVINTGDGTLILELVSYNKPEK